MSDAMHAVEVDRLTMHYNVKPILKDVSFRVRTGDVAAIIGPNASGKTTLMSVLAGLVSPIGGEVRLFGLPRRTTVEDELRIRRRVCFLPVDGFELTGLTVRETCLATAELYARDMEAAFSQVERLAAAFELTGSLDSQSYSLSTGQRRKAAIAAALMSDAETLLLDEPFSGGLDPSGIRALKSILRHLSRDRGRTIVFTIPVPELVEDLADQVIVLGGTGIVVDASPGDVLRQAGGARNLSDALARLAFPTSDENVEAYVQGEVQSESGRDANPWAAP